MLALLVLLVPLAADVPPACRTPKIATATFLEALNADPPKLDEAATCADPALPRAEAAASLVKLKRVLDARGITVHLEDLPDDAAYRDATTGFPRVKLTSDLQGLELVQSDGAWVFPRATLAHADALYAETFPIDVARFVERWPRWTRVPVFGVAVWQVAVLGVLALLGFLARLLVASFLSSQLRRLMARIGARWGNKLVSDAALPLGNLALAGIIALGLPAVQLGVQAAVVAFLAVRVVAAVSLVMLLYRAVDLFGLWLETKSQKTDTKLDDQLVPIVRRALKVVTVVIGVIFVLQNLDVDVTSLLTGLGLGGLAFALAAKDVVSNFFGSVTIFLDKPFQIGDWVAVSGIEGIVEEVGIRSTRIRTFYNSIITVPNGKFTEAIVDNYGMRKHRRTSITLSITYDTTPAQIEALCDGVRAILKAHPAVRKDAYEVHFAGYGDSGLNVMLYFFFTVPTWSQELRARHEVFLDVLKLAERLHVRFAFPTRTLHIESQAAPTALAPGAPPSTEALVAEVTRFAPGGDAVTPPGPRLGEPYLPVPLR